MLQSADDHHLTDLATLDGPSKWPGVNARLLGLGVGLPTKPLDRLAAFSASEFERFILEWATAYLPGAVKDFYEAQQRGGAGDKGRDIIVFLDPPTVPKRRWRLYQAKHLIGPLTVSEAAAEIAKVLYWTHLGAYGPPEEYWFVTHRSVAGPLQDLLNDAEALRDHILENWDKQCAPRIGKIVVDLTDPLREHVAAFDFSIFRWKPPLTLIEEHSKTKYHLTVFGAPLIERGPSPTPPSTVDAAETAYIAQLYAVIAQRLGVPIATPECFEADAPMKELFERSRITFYCAEQLKELARDRMADSGYFDSLLKQFEDGLYHSYTDHEDSGIRRLRETVKAAQSLQLGAEALAPHVTSNDREGACHHLANDGKVTWCGK